MEIVISIVALYFFVSVIVAFLTYETLKNDPKFNKSKAIFIVSAIFLWIPFLLVFIFGDIYSERKKK